MSFRNFVGVIFLMMFTFVARAEVQTLESRIWRKAAQLPSGQQTWSTQTSYRRSAQRFSANGKLQPLGARYARATTWQQLIDAENSAEAKAQLNEYMQQENLRPEDVAAVSQYQVEREETVVQLGWAYGLTSNWMVGLEFPLTWSRTRVQTDVALAPRLQNFNGVRAAPEKMRERVQIAAEHALSNSGYDQVPDEKQTLEAGDISILNQQTLLRRYNWTWALQELVRLPTSRSQSAFEYIQLSRDEGQIDAGLVNSVDYRWRKWLLGAKASYVAQLPDTVKMHSEGSDDVDPKVQRDLGDWYALGMDAEYQWRRRWSFSGGYSYLNKNRDKYSGRFDQFAQNTDQEQHLSRIGLDYLFEYSGVRQGIEDKWQVSLNYYRALAARNTIDGDRSAVELIGYF